MKFAVAHIAGAVIGYAAGHLPSAAIVSKLVDRSVDPRRAGTGNPGAANVGSLLGSRAGAAVATMDASKAIAAAQLGRTIAGPAGANVAAAASVLGHCFPVHRGFRGGKGVAASLGQMLATFPAYLPVDIALGSIAAKSDFWKRRPVATIAATCALWVALAELWRRRGWPNLWASPAGGSLPIASLVSSVAIVYRFAVEAASAPPVGGEGD